MSGSFGSLIRDYAKFIADNGYLAAIPHYFERSNTAESSDVTGDISVLQNFSVHRDEWVATLADCVGAVGHNSDVKPDKIALLGFSLGGHLVLRTALQPSVKAKAVIDFFGPIAMLGGLGGNLKRLPPIQIHHGKNDEIVRPSESKDFAAALVLAGKAENVDFEKYLDYEEGHGFTGAKAVADSRSRVSKFLTSHFG
jgi:dienelactone hydrolase